MKKIRKKKGVRVKVRKRLVSAVGPSSGVKIMQFHLCFWWPVLGDIWAAVTLATFHFLRRFRQKLKKGQETDKGKVQKGGIETKVYARQMIALGCLATLLTQAGASPIERWSFATGGSMGIEDGTITTNDNISKSMVEPLNDLVIIESEEAEVRRTKLRRTSPVVKGDDANTYYSSLCPW